MIINNKSVAEGLLLTAVAVPYSWLGYFSIANILINPYEICYLGIIITCIIKITNSYKLAKQSFIPLILLLVISVYFFVGILSHGPMVMINHIRYYLPFIVGCFWVMAGIRLTDTKFANRFFVAILISSSAAILNHFYGFITRPTEMSVMAVGDAERMPWDNAALVLPLFFLLFATKNKSRWQVILATCTALAAVFAMFLTFNRTLAILSLVLALGSWYVTRDKTLASNLREIMIVGLFALVIAGYIVLSENAWVLFEYRYLGGGGGASQMYEENFEKGRFIIYEYFLEKFLENPLFGLGFGIPLWMDFFNSKYDTLTTDISFVAFTLPMGLTGLLLFIYWLRSILMIIRIGISEGIFSSYTRRQINYLFLLFFWISIATSLNIDIFSRNLFVVIFACIATLKPERHN